jgi:hypothetical protein
MSIALASDLAWLHDAVATEFRYEIAENGNRRLTIFITANPNMGHPTWDGHRLKLTAHDVLLLKWTALGHSTNEESIDAWREAVINSFSEIGPFLDMGGRTPAQAWKVSFHTGSSFDLVCERVTVSILD